MQYLNYLFFRASKFMFSIVSFNLLYKISDILYLLLFYVFKYRKKIVFKNLNSAFPHKTKVEINTIAQKFYRNLADILLESLKGLSMTGDELVRRYKGINTKLVNAYAAENQSIVAMGAHYANWEWGAVCAGLQYDLRSIGIYKQLSNKRIDNYIKKLRAKLNMNLVATKDTATSFEALQGQNCAFIMLADQRPSSRRLAYDIDFLGQKTLCLHGSEKYARSYNYPVVFIDIQRVKRGFYTFTLSEICRDPSKLPAGEITKIFMQKLENRILQQPENWLWSHNRWKKLS